MYWSEGEFRVSSNVSVGAAAGTGPRRPMQNPNAPRSEQLLAPAQPEARDFPPSPALRQPHGTPREGHVRLENQRPSWMGIITDGNIQIYP